MINFLVMNSWATLVYTALEAVLAATSVAPTPGFCNLYTLYPQSNLDIDNHHTEWVKNPKSDFFFPSVMAIQAGHAKALQPLECRDPGFQSHCDGHDGLNPELTGDLCAGRIFIAAHMWHVCQRKSKTCHARESEREREAVNRADRHVTAPRSFK